MLPASEIAGADIGPWRRRAVQQRKSTRYRLRAPAIYRWNDVKGVTHQDAGFTRDIAMGGVFIQSANYPPPGTVISLEVVLPPLSGSDKSIRLQTQSLVLRTEKKGDQSGFAASARFALHEGRRIDEGTDT
jgi:hypothetical protein